MASISVLQIEEDGSEPSRSAILGGSFNGRTAVFEAAYVGSIPTPPTKMQSPGSSSEGSSLIRTNAGMGSTCIRDHFHAAIAQK